MTEVTQIDRPPAATAQASAALLSVRNIEVVYDDVILVLRGLSLEAMRGNLQAIIERSQARQARVLLVGMFLPPNFGPDFDAKFHGVFEELARRNHLAFTPFLMEGFADRLDWFQADGIHPQARAEPLMLDNVWAALRPLLRD